MELKKQESISPKLVKEFREIKKKKELLVDNDDIQDIMNALDFYKNHNTFKPEYKERLDRLRSYIVMLGEW